MNSNSQRTPSFLYMIAVTVLLSVTTQASAGTPQWISYAAKFVCNASSADDLLIQGKYRTTVNIHNPHYLVEPAGAQPVPVTFFKKVVFAKPQGQQPLLPSCHQQEYLPADGALAVTCNNIKTLAQLSGLPTSGVLEGFVIIEVPPYAPLAQSPALDVVAVYTARLRTGTDPDVRKYDVRALEVERMPPTTIIGEPVINLCPPN